MPTWEIAEVVKLEPEDLHKWVQVALGEPSDARNQFNWLGLAETLAFDARQQTDVAEKIRLAELAVTIYEWLGNREQEDSYTDSALALTLYLLKHKYVDSSHQLLGTSKVQRPWARISLTASAARRVSLHLKAKVSQDTSQVSSAEKEQLKLLRQIKNKLRLIKQLPPGNELLREAQAKGWLEVLEDLP